MSFPKALTSLVGFPERWFPNRINRHLDDKDDLLAQALSALESKSATDYPEITEVPAATLSPSVGAGAVTGLTIDGVNFIGDAVKASGATENSSGQVSFEAVVPGEQTIVVTVTNTGVAAAVTADAAAGTIDVVHGSGGSGAGGAATAAELAAAINGDAVAKYMVNATVDTAGDMDADESVTLTGGEGEVLTLSIGGDPFDGTAAGEGITDVSDTTITFDLDATGMLAGGAYAISLRVDGVKVEAPFMVPVA